MGDQHSKDLRAGPPCIFLEVKAVVDSRPSVVGGAQRVYAKRCVLSRCWGSGSRRVLCMVGKHKAGDELGPDSKRIVLSFVAGLANSDEATRILKCNRLPEPGAIMQTKEYNNDFEIGDSATDRSLGIIHLYKQK